MICPICMRQLIKTGQRLWVQMNSFDSIPSLQNTYQCTNPECDSYREGIMWTYNGEAFIIHRLEAFEEVLT